MKNLSSAEMFEFDAIKCVGNFDLKCSPRRYRIHVEVFYSQHAKAGHRCFVTVSEVFGKICELYSGIYIRPENDPIGHAKVNRAACVKMNQRNISLVGYKEQLREWISRIELVPFLNGKPWVAF